MVQFPLLSNFEFSNINTTEGLVAIGQCSTPFGIFTPSPLLSSMSPTFVNIFILPLRTLDKQGKISSIKTTGSVIGNGTVKIYIEKDGKKYLIYKK